MASSSGVRKRSRKWSLSGLAPGNWRLTSTLGGTTSGYFADRSSGDADQADNEMISTTAEQRSACLRETAKTFTATASPERARGLVTVIHQLKGQKEAVPSASRRYHLPGSVRRISPSHAAPLDTRRRQFSATSD